MSYKDKWFDYLRERWGAQVPKLTPANNPDPVCRDCWDKGYASYTETVSWGVDFPGDKPGKRTQEVKKFCHCRRGRRLEVQDAYERGKAGAK